MWIPGHASVESADNYAKQAVVTGRLKYNKCFPKDLQALVKHMLLGDASNMERIEKK